MRREQSVHCDAFQVVRKEEWWVRIYQVLHCKGQQRQRHLRRVPKQSLQLKTHILNNFGFPTPLIPPLSFPVHVKGSPPFLQTIPPLLYPQSFQHAECPVHLVSNKIRAREMLNRLYQEEESTLASSPGKFRKTTDLFTTIQK